MIGEKVRDSQWCYFLSYLLAQLLRVIYIPNQLHLLMQMAVNTSIAAPLGISSSVVLATTPITTEHPQQSRDFTPTTVTSRTSILTAIESNIIALSDKLSFFHHSPIHQTLVLSPHRDEGAVILAPSHAGHVAGVAAPFHKL